MLRKIYGHNMYTDAATLFAPVMILFAVKVDFVRQIMDADLFQWLGRISVSLYFWHSIARTVVRITIFNNTLLGLLIYIALAYVFAQISLVFIEPKIKKLNDSILRYVQ